jgi:two-component system, OmpR family, sensor histidine kinase VicK
MQREFINVAAHELRTPVQPILGLSEVLQYQIKDDKQRSMVDVISRNAKRLQRLTEDILDVT